MNESGSRIGPWQWPSDKGNVFFIIFLKEWMWLLSPDRCFFISDFICSFGNYRNALYYSLIGILEYSPSWLMGSLLN